MAEKKKLIRVGELLVESGLLQSSDVVEAVQVAKRVQIPIGRVLIASGLVDEAMLQTVLQVQLLVRDESISLKQAIEAIRLVHKEGLSLKDALQTFNLSSGVSIETADLAKILRDSDVVSQEDLDAAIQTSSSAGIPLSGALVLQGVISQSFYPNVARAQQQLKAKMPREKIIDELKSSFLFWLKAEETLKREFASYSADVNETIQNETMQIDRERGERSSQETETPDGSSPSKPNGRKEVRADRHGRRTATISRDTRTLAAERSQAPLRLVDVLKVAGVIDQAGMQKVYDDMLEDPIASGKALCRSGLLDQETLHLALRCHSLLKKKLITVDEAIKAIDDIRSGHTPFAGSFLAESDWQRARYLDQNWRKQTLFKAIGCAVIGALAGGLLLGRRR